MACALLGEQFDLHGGGADLQFPHHDNEIAQSEGANGIAPAVVWAHNGLLNVDQVKMSKSLGNFFTIREVLQRYDGETIRFFMLRTHYRSPFSFSDLNLGDARNSMRRLYTALDGIDVPEQEIDWQQSQAAAFRAAMNDDFNTPVAVAVLFELAGELNRTRSVATASLLKGLAGTLAVLQQSPRNYLQAGSGLDESRIAERIDARGAAKKNRDFALADQIRQELLAQGIVLQDSPAGTTWMKA
jgi:cysteinyl-tRNA synthetase